MSPARRVVLSEERLRELMMALDEPGSCQPIDPSLLDRYMNHTATEAESRQVQESLARSGSLREELLALRAASDLQSEFKDARTPGRKPFFLRPSQLRIFSLAATLAVILVGTLYFLRPQNPEYATFTLDGQYYEEQFEIDVQRSGSPQSEPVARDLREAALLAFRDRVSWGDHGLVVLPAPDPQTVSGIRIVLDTGEAYSVAVPPGATGVQLAFLATPSLQLFMADFDPSSKTQRVKIPGEGLLAVAYRQDGQPRASLASPAK